MLRRIKNLNYPLLIGGILVILILFIVSSPHKIVKIDPYSRGFISMLYTSKGFTVKNPPLPPNSINMWGTDIVGRDLFSQVVYGARLTLTIGLIVALLRLVLALPLSFLAGFREKISSKVIDFFSMAFSTIPALIVSMMILNIEIIRSFDLVESIIAFSIVLTLVGWGRLARHLRDRIKEILNQDFIIGQIAIGKNKLMIALQNVLPHLVPTVIITFFLEMSRVLILLGQLGVFGVYVGEKYFNTGDLADMGLRINPSYTPELGSLIASARYGIIAGKLWIVIYPAFAFFVLVLAFNLFGEGLKIEVNKRNSRIISWVKKIPYHLSPKTYLHELENYRKYLKPVIIKTIVIIIILFNIIVPPQKSLFSVDGHSVYAHIEELNKSEYKGRLIGTEGRDKAAEYIVNKLRGISSVEPFFENGYIQDIDKTMTFADLQKSEMYVVGDDGSRIAEYKYKKDYNFNLKNVVFDGQIEGKILTYDQFIEKDYNEEDKYFLVMRSNYDYLTDRANRISNLYYVFQNECIIGVFVPYEQEYLLQGRTLFTLTEEKGGEDLVIPITEQTSYTLWGFSGRELVIDNKVRVMENIRVKNIGGIIKANEPTEETLVIATNYDYLGYDEEDKYKGLFYNGTSVGAMLEIVKHISTLNIEINRDIVILFLDGSNHFRRTGAKYFIESNYRGKLGDFYVITMNNLGLKGKNILYFQTTSRFTEKSNDYFKYMNYVQERAKSLGIKAKRDSLLFGYEDFNQLCSYGASGIHFQSINRSQFYNYYGIPQNNINMIDEERLKKQTQLILDSIVHIVHDSE